jgi:hypothetical protein
MPKKPKTTQPETPNEVQGRDFFQTPNYAVDLLVPFIPHNIDSIWECASGYGKIAKRLRHHGFQYVKETDIRRSLSFNFIEDKASNPLDCIITNPPFSIKYKFIHRALEYDVPFAFLIPFDMCQKMARLFMDHGCQGLVPTARIDYITPTGLSGATGHTSYYHSLWLTYKFNLPQQLTFVELTKEMKENI